MSVDCPYDGCSRTFDNELGMKSHHSRVHDESLAGVAVECDACGSQFRKRSDHAERFDHHFCDEQCEGDWRSEHLSGESSPNWKGGESEVECFECGEAITRRRDKVETYDRHFCSSNCERAWRRRDASGSNNVNWRDDLDVECSSCGATLHRSDYYHEQNEHHFCDFDCLGEWRSEHQTGEEHPNWAGGVSSRYGSNWQEQRSKAKRRDGHECRVCGLSNRAHERRHEEGLHVHHIVPRRRFLYRGRLDDELANRLSNLVTLCRVCHPKMEGEPRSFILS